MGVNCAVIAYILAYILAPFLFFLLPEVEQPIDEIAFGDKNVILTCTATHSGPIILTLKSCSVDVVELCKEIDTIYDSGIPCDEYSLERTADAMTIIHTSGSLVRTYAFEDLDTDDK